MNMKSHKLLLAALAFGSALMTTGCRDDFSEMNQDPSAVTTGNISFLFAEAVNRFDPQPYLEYYYNAPMKYAWAGMGLSTSGASESILTLTIDGDQARQYISVLRVLRAMEAEYEKLSDEDKALNDVYMSAANIMSIYMGIFATDMYGAIPYVEACNAAYGGSLTPGFDSVESLYNLWLEQLNSSISTFTSSEAVMKADQDVVYGGDKAKWAKFANSLKLRIAVRLLSQNEAKAKQIASEVESASCGYLNSLDEDVRFHKGDVRLTGDQGYVNDRIYHWSNGFTGVTDLQDVPVLNQSSISWLTTETRVYVSSTRRITGTLRLYRDITMQVWQFLTLSKKMWFTKLEPMARKTSYVGEVRVNLGYVIMESPKHGWLVQTIPVNTNGSSRHHIRMLIRNCICTIQTVVMRQVILYIQL